MQLLAGSTTAFAGELLGTTADVLASYDRAGSAYRYRQRLAADAPLVAIMPAWLRDSMRADLAHRPPGDDELAESDADIVAMFFARHVTPVWSIDWRLWTQTDHAALVGWPSHVNALLFAPGTWLHLDGGSLDLGVVRSPTLNQTNDAELFVESFEAAAMVGIESVHLDLDVCPSGKTSLPVTIDPCSIGS